ncbi:hypothetical protein N7528_006567 [Penicillium herquei]|nr:hypothetical protein N7528_006567 [Penicillium herquei]
MAHLPSSYIPSSNHHHPPAYSCSRSRSRSPITQCPVLLSPHCKSYTLPSKCLPSAPSIMPKASEPRQRAEEGQGKYPCPCKEDEGCGKMYTTTSGAIRHARKKHGYDEVLEMIARASKRAMEGDESSSPRKRAKAERESSPCPSEETDICDKRPPWKSK